MLGFNKGHIVLILCSLVSTRTANADALIEDPPEYRDNHHWVIDQLPKGIAGEAEKLSAYADFNHPSQPQDLSPCVPIYLINRSNKVVTVRLTDLEAEFLLEVQIDGQWMRARPYVQPRYDSHWLDMTVRPGEFIMVAGHLPADSQHTAPARYRRVNLEGKEIFTNLGDLPYDPTQVEAARSDTLAVSHELDFEQLLALLRHVLRSAEDQNFLVTPRDIFRAMGTRYPEQSLAWVADLDEQSLNTYVLQDLAELYTGIAKSETLTTEQLVKLYHQRSGTGNTRLDRRIPNGMIAGIAKRSPDIAMQMMEDVDPNTREGRSVIQSGLTGMYSERSSYDEQVASLHAYYKFRQEGQASIAAFIALQFPEQALTLRFQLRERYGERAAADIRQIEKRVFERMTAHQLISVLEDDVNMLEHEQEWVRQYATSLLLFNFTDQARETMDRWQADEDTSPALQAIALRISQGIAKYEHYHEVMDRVPARLVPRTDQ